MPFIDVLGILFSAIDLFATYFQVCNHPELFERNEGNTYLYFGDIPNSLVPAPFGELEDVYYSGSRSPITYEVKFEHVLSLLVFYGSHR